MRRSMRTDEDKTYWSFVESTAKKVATWPERTAEDSNVSNSTRIEAQADAQVATKMEDRRRE